ncbi:CoA transferase [Rhodococcus sp. KBW08]|uniref:CaiB/BaiF CoA transferase family protein n=1 Tax=Rhodococcus sp. KBW08 TaxID=2144188 RepID=UPI000F5A4D8E|nr:CaiB/BaiF CoA-transferase family protein [Rhodococcus sp. KBW08]RQO46035.1 CoA transferase [Rhodococcus sp. KBW08]
MNDSPVNGVEGALEGVRVVDLSRIMAGPWCTQNLADLGADVIKIERSGVGDDTRGWGPPFLPLSKDPNDVFSAYFISCNRGKRSLELDLDAEEDRKVLLELVADADIVVENFRAGTLDRRGLGYESLRKVKPDLIYLAITGFGQDGPLAHRPGYDYVFQGMGGLMSYTGPEDGASGAGPFRTGVAVIDLMCGMYATTSVLAALHKRGRTGEGSYVDLALLDVAVALNGNQASNYLVSGTAPTRSGNAHPNCAPYEVFETTDGFIILAIGNDGQFARFCKVVESEELSEDSRFQTNAGRLQNIAALRPVISAFMLSRPTAEWIELFEKSGVPWGPINTLDQVFNDPQVRHRDLRVEVGREGMASVPMVRNPMLIGSTVGTAPPRLGEHNNEIRAELAFRRDEYKENI